MKRKKSWIQMQVIFLKKKVNEKKAQMQNKFSFFFLGEEEFQAYAMEEESDDEGNRRETKNHKKPAFIRDLVRYLADKEDPVRLEIGLKSAEEMIRQSIGNGTELGNA